MSLEEFAQTIMSMKSSLNNPDAFEKWLKNEIEFEEPPIQGDINKVSISQLSSCYVRLIYVLHYAILFSVIWKGSQIYFP